jgi:hypothetical protein
MGGRLGDVVSLSRFAFVARLANERLGSSLFSAAGSLESAGPRSDFIHGCCVEEFSLAEVDCGHIMYAAVH